MSRKPRIPKRMQAIVDQCRGGQTLCKFLRQKQTGETEAVFFYEPSGRSCPPRNAEKAISAGLLKPSGDGLFGAETSQTFVTA